MSKKREEETARSFEAAEASMRERAVKPTLAKSAPPKSPAWLRSIRRHRSTALGLLAGVAVAIAGLYALHVYTRHAKAGEWPPVQTFEDRWQMPCVNLGNCPKTTPGMAPTDKAKPGQLTPQGGGQSGHGGGGAAAKKRAEYRSFIER